MTGKQEDKIVELLELILRHLRKMSRK